MGQEKALVQRKLCSYNRKSYKEYIKSQLKDGIDGIIVSLDNEGCARGIIDLIRDKNLQNKLIENTKENDYSNMKEVQKIYDKIK